ncbi:MAG: hypothetical protein RQ751_00720 [Longimicrobiales bacterium]|nr:hypothetical protein [Longimicrobiales bacterium]
MNDLPILTCGAPGAPRAPLRAPRPHLIALAAVLLIPAAAAPARAQEGPGGQAVEPAVAALVEQARAARNGETFASAVAGLVRAAHQRPAQAPAVAAALTGFVRGEDVLRRALAVDALRTLPPRTRETLVPVLAELARSRGEGPAARLFVRGLAEAAGPGRSALRGLVDEDALRGDALALARMYLRG